MGKLKKIPGAVIPRLSRYYRALLESRKIDIISSEELANLSGTTAAQARKDLTYFGQFGTPGRGYQVNDLKARILSILGIDRVWNAALIGIGNLGKAFLSYSGFKKQGFNIICTFDADKRKIGKIYGNVKVQNTKELLDTIVKQKVKIAILTTPASCTQEIADTLVKAGVKAILNFAPIRPIVPPKIKVLNIDLSIELERLVYFLAKKK